jgi:thiamine pyridinylase
MRLSTLGGLVLATVGAACNSLVQERTPFRVALFPYIPSPKEDARNGALASRIEREFEARFPSVDLVLLPCDGKQDFYNPLVLAELLTGPEAVDLLEVDSVLLGCLIDLELISPWEQESVPADWLPVAREGFTVDGMLYGVPHWLCGHFIVTRDERVARAGTAAELKAALQLLDPGTRNLTGDFTGSWNTPALYLDAWADTFPGRQVDDAVTIALDRGVVQTLRSLFEEGSMGGDNPCQNGTYRDNDHAAIEFAKGRADAFLGYSERLHYILGADGIGKDLYVSSA